MKLFQIEEPDGSPQSSDGPGVAVGIELSAAKGAAVAVAVGGNAEVIIGADGSRRIAVTGFDAPGLTTLLLSLRERAEKALAQPVTHAVVVLDRVAAAAVGTAAPAAGLTVLRLVDVAAAAGAGSADAPVLSAAIDAEDALRALG